jgi:plasmid stability protein
MGPMEVTIKVPDKLAAEARAHGVSVEVYVQEILARQALETAGEQPLPSVCAAIDRILELRKGNKLAGLRTKDFVHEGHKY